MEKAEAPRERILGAAYELFSQNGVGAIGVDRVIETAGVAKASLYRNFGSKGKLVEAAFERRDKLWTRDWLEAGLATRGGSPGERLLAIFDLFGEWFRRKDFEGCMFISTLLESHDPKSAMGRAAIDGLEGVRSLPRALAEEAGVKDAARFARRWQLLMSGSIISATQGNRAAADDAREIAVLILDKEGIPH